jgi:hypothetical protein
VAIPLLDAAGMRELDRITIEEVGIPGTVLMEVAGRGCAEAVEELLGGAGRVAVVCGKGNNGGDGFVAARHLMHAGCQVDVFLIADPKKLSGDAKLNKEILDKLKQKVVAIPDESKVKKLDLSGYDSSASTRPECRWWRWTFPRGSPPTAARSWALRCRRPPRSPSAIPRSAT